MTAPFNQNECPICMDNIDGLSNRVTTECGHTFHCSCLMQNAAHNGFGCPYCRTTMAEIPDDSDSDDSDDDSDGFYNDEEDEFLTSFRMFHQQLNGQEVEEEVEDSDADSADWSTDSDSSEDSDEEEGELVEGVIVEGRFIEGGVRRQPVIREGQPVEERGLEEGGVRGVPPVVVEADSAHITQKLIERGITFEDLVKTILFHEHDNYADRYAHHERRSSEIYGQFNAVMSRFRNDQIRRPNLNQVVPLVPNPQVVPLEKTLTFSHTEITLHNI